jgi:TonB-dependent receptor
MYKTQSFRKKMLATAIASVAAGLSGSYAFAQDDAVVEEVLVTGIRASLMRSMDTKRESAGVVDAINAEDIGKFPDTNLAESLQRIPGVSIDRASGEGSRVTVRGVDPAANLVTFNGRTVARTTGDRSYEFANIASELVSSVSVAKTGNALIDSGGMGATINIQTARPLESPGQKFAVSVKGVMDQSNDEGEAVTPEVFGIYSNTFADDTIGVSVAVGYQERDSGERVALVDDGWHSFNAATDLDVGNANWGSVPKTGQTNRPTGANEIYSTPQSMRYSFNEAHRERTNGQLVLQWEPIESLRATLDVDVFERTIDSTRNDMSAWYTFANQHAVWSDGPVSEPLIYTESYVNAGTLPTRANGAQDFAMASRMYSQKDTGSTVGVNLVWDITDEFKLIFDASNSTAKMTPNNDIASAANIQAAAFIRTSNSADFSGEIPGMIIGNGQSLQPTDMQVVGSWFQNNLNNSDVDQYKLAGKFQFNDDNSIDFGVHLTDVYNRRRNSNVQRDDWGGVGNVGDLASIYQGTDHSIVDHFDGSFGDFSRAGQLPGGATLADGTTLTAANQINRFFAPDFFVLRKAMQDRYNYTTFQGQGISDIATRRANGQTVGYCGGESLFCASDEYEKGTDIIVDEETQAFFAQYDFKSELASMPFTAQLGFRYESTDVVSSSASPTYTGAEWFADTEIRLLGGPIGYGEQEGGYDKFLPNLNLGLGVTDDVMVRFSASKSIGRPDFTSLQGGFAVNGTANRGGGSGSSGNPDLEPLESVNLDLSVEWYFADDGYASLGVFQKEISNYITTNPVNQSLFGIHDPASGPYVDAAVAALGNNDGRQIRAWIAQNRAGQPGVIADAGGDPNKVVLVGIAANPFMNFAIQTPQNGTEERTLNGIEAAVQYVFGDSGFGTIVNATVVDSDLVFDDSNLLDQQALPGLSDTYNLIGFYENYGASVRLSYNWRDEFLSARGNPRGLGPTYTEAYGQFDLNVSYDFLDHFQVFLQGINITEESTRLHVRDRDAVLNYTETGARWIVGGTYKF